MYPLKDDFILDSGATVHITNKFGLLQEIRKPSPGDCIQAGNSKLWIRAYGTVTLKLPGPSGPTWLRLKDVAWCPDIVTNLVSFNTLRRQGIYWDTQGEPTTLRHSDSSCLTMLYVKHGQFVIPTIDEPAALVTTKQRRSYRTSMAYSDTWHRRLGHPGPEALKQLIHQAEGVRIATGIHTVDCDACG